MIRRIAWLPAAAATVISGSAMADTLFVDLAGYQSWGFYGTPTNSHISITLDAGTQITGIDFVDFAFTAEGNSYMDELTVSVNDSSAAINFWDSGVPGAGAGPGTFGPVSAAFDNPGVFGSGPFTMTTNSLYIEVYDQFDDGGIGTRDAIVNSGGILITYTPIPGPSALAAMALLCLAPRRRRS